MLAASILFFSRLAFLSALEIYKSGVTASYYAEDFHGKRTSNGERFNMYDYTCAHKSLPFGTVLRVTNLSNGKSCDVRVNDRGPFVASREIDLSKAAAVKLDMIGSGTAKVKLEIVTRGADTKLSQQTAASASKIMAKLGSGNSANKTSTSGSETSTSLKNSTSSNTSKTSNNSPKEKSTTQKLTPGTFWDIQLGAFSSKENAKDFARKLSRAGFHDIVLQTSASKGITRVAIKKVPANKVTDTQNQLAAAGFKDQTLKKRKS